MQIVLAYFLIIAIVSAPIFAWRPTRKTAPFAVLFYIVFLLMHWQFVIGAEGAWHDTSWNLQNWASLVSQWVYSDNILGWNPYWGAGQPFAVNNNLLTPINFLFFSLFFKSLGLHFRPEVFFNLVFTFGYFNICSGSLLLFRVLYRDPYVCFIGFISLLFGGLFFADLAQNVGIYVLSFLPWLLFFLIDFVKTGRLAGLLLFSLGLGTAVNYYVPTYVSLTVVLFILLSLVFPDKTAQADRRVLFSRIKEFLSNPRWILACIILLLLTAAPLFFSYFEMKDFISPTRGFSAGGWISSKQTGAQGNLRASFKSYRLLFDSEGFVDTKETIGLPESEFYLNTHTAFYIGVLPSLLLLVSIFLGANRIFLALTACLVVLAAGHNTPVWGWMMDNVPLIHITRHTFLFARLATFSALVASLAGFAALADRNISFARKFFFIIAVAVVLYYCFPGEPSARKLTAIFIGVLVLTMTAYSMPKEGVMKTLMIPLLLTAHFTDMGEFSMSSRMKLDTQLPLNDISYPQHWVSMPGDQSASMPADFMPMLNKGAAWGHPFPNFMYWLQKDFARFGLRQHLLTKIVPLDNSLRTDSGDMFYILPAIDGWGKDKTAVQALKNIFGTLIPDFETVGGSSFQIPFNPSNATDIDPATFWHIDLSQSPPHWIAFKVFGIFNANVLRVTPRRDAVRLWRDDRAELQVSDDGNTWIPLQKLDLRKTIFDGSNKPVDFQLENPITHKYFRLVTNDPQFMSLAEVELFERNPPKTAKEQADVIAFDRVFNKIGQFEQIPSRDANKVSLNVHMEREGYILHMANFHKGWQATVDDVKEPITKVYPNFQMIPVRSGDHTVFFEFKSAYYYVVLLHIFIAGLGGIAMLIWLAVPIKMRKK